MRAPQALQLFRYRLVGIKWAKLWINDSQKWYKIEPIQAQRSYQCNASDHDISLIRSAMAANGRWHLRIEFPSFISSYPEVPSEPVKRNYSFTFVALIVHCIKNITQSHPKYNCKEMSTLSRNIFECNVIVLPFVQLWMVKISNPE